MRPKIDHPEEHLQAGHLEEYHWNHQNARYHIAFSDGEEYIGVFDTAYESDNAGELGIEMDDPEYDEFFVVDIEIQEILHDGSRRLNQYLSLDYRDFPEKIIDITNDTVVYQVNPPKDSEESYGETT
ncbi:hypothetical protein ACRQD2_02200 [Actinotignum sp. GS-2025e]|nr:MULTISPECIES: hypothetical protein [Actinotignum]MDK8534611.1 hypothetical protein [Gleimia europaea]MDY5137608.1 hypothetical protein [Actinotignum timonense]